MPRSRSLALAFSLLAASVLAGAQTVNDQALWQEFGLVRTQTSKLGRLTVTAYETKDVTGALGAWEWLRSPKGRPCDLASFCTSDGSRTVIAENNYVVTFDGGPPAKTQAAAFLQALPNQKDTTLPAILTFVPTQGLVPDSARYILGPVSLKAFAPELASLKPGFNEGAEAQVAEYALGKGGPPVRLAIFYYPAPEMARLQLKQFQSVIPPTHVKRSGVLLAAVLGQATDDQADTVLSRIEYQAKITWNDSPPPGPIKPLYQLLVNIGYLSAVLVALCSVAGLIYAGMRVYRRRYGTLESDEAMTTLHLTGE